MNMVGTNNECKNDSLGRELKKCGYQLLVKPVRWPRKRGPAHVRVHVGVDVRPIWGYVEVVK